MKDMARGKQIIVTGSGAGLGAAIVYALRGAGATIIEYDAKDGNDVRQPGSWVRMLSRVDGLVNCAGVNANDWFDKVTVTQLQDVMAVNAFGPVLMAQAVLPQLRAAEGFVCNIVSNAAHIPMTSSLAYNMSKAAALMATKQMAHELTKSQGITVFSISPNKLEGTEMSEKIESEVQRVRGWTPEYAAHYQRQSLMHGLETPPRAVADVLVNLLASGAWKYMSGTDVPVGK